MIGRFLALDAGHPAWMADAACRNHDPSLFATDFEGRSDETTARRVRRIGEAKKVCWEPCPVFNRCRDRHDVIERGRPANTISEVVAGETPEERVQRRRASARTQRETVST